MHKVGNKELVYRDGTWRAGSSYISSKKIGTKQTWTAFHRKGSSKPCKSLNEAVKFLQAKEAPTNSYTKNFDKISWPSKAKHERKIPAKRSAGYVMMEHTGPQFWKSWCGKYTLYAKTATLSGKKYWILKKGNHRILEINTFQGCLNILAKESK